MSPASLPHVHKRGRGRPKGAKSKEGSKRPGPKPGSRRLKIELPGVALSVEDVEDLFFVKQQLDDFDEEEEEAVLFQVQVTRKEAMSGPDAQHFSDADDGV